MRYTDRSRTALDWTCPRARYWGYEWQGIGLAPMETPKELDFGLKMAEQTARIKQGQAWSVGEFQTGDIRAVAEALLVGYETLVWPRWKRDFDLVSVEEEQPLPLSAWLTYNTRPDTITRRRSDQSLWYGPEDKTTAYVDSLLNYANSVQLHSTAIAIEHHRPGERVAGCLVQGLYKGFEKEQKLYHPLVYAYCKEGRPGIIPDQWSGKWVRGWERTPTWQYPGGVKAWLQSDQVKDKLGECFPNSEPVTIKRPMVERYLAQLVQRESEIESWRQEGSSDSPEALDKTFPQHFSQCDGFGKGRRACGFKEACFNQTARKFPLTFYKKREPHHRNEEEAFKQ